MASFFQYKLTVPKLGNVSDLSAALSNFVNVLADKVRANMIIIVFRG